MYICENMIELGLEESEEWKSRSHRIVAQKVLLCNPTINNRDLLTRGVGLINNIPNDAIEEITMVDLKEIGCPGIT